MSKKAAPKTLKPGTIVHAEQPVSCRMRQRIDGQLTFGPTQYVNGSSETLKLVVVKARLPYVHARIHSTTSVLFVDTREVDLFKT
jgi:hypothetical protein